MGGIYIMKRTGLLAQCVRLLFATALIALISACTASANEYRAFWVNAWDNGFLNQSQVEQLLGKKGDPNSLGDVRNANCNAVFVQVRRRADTCYPSGAGEPYFSGSPYLSPTNFNALQAMIDAAHDTTGGKKRIEVHCWIVTFATAGSGMVSPYYYQHNNPADPNNYWVTLDDAGNETSDKAFDPGHPKCEQHIVDVAMDLVKNFDIDGIHYDYIRFTGSNQGYNPTSVARYNTRYGLTGKPLATDEQFRQWRRDQVTAVVRKVYAEIQAVKPWVKQSGSFVTWNPSPTSSTRAAFQATRPYYDVYSDWDSWMQEGIVDMAVPMTYYNQASLPSDYQRWINFEKDRKFNRLMVIGPGIYLNSLSNAILQLQMTRTPSPAGNYADGFSGYDYQLPYASGSWSGFTPTFVSQVCPTWDDVPDMPWKSHPTKGHISGTVTYNDSGAWADGATVAIDGPEKRTMTCDGTGFYAFIDLTPGTYTVTASKSGYPSMQKTITVAVGAVTGNMYVTDMALGGISAPVISNVMASNVTNNGATIQWSTDQDSTSQVEYGLTDSYGISTPINNTPAASHAVTLAGLTPNTLYHYHVISTSPNGTGVSADYTFTTAGPPSVTPPQVTNITSSSATITWNCGTAADGMVYYGTTASYGSQASDNTVGAAHSVSLMNLNPGTIYHFQCVSTNAYGISQSGDLTFTTSIAPVETVIDNTDPGWSNTSNSGSWTTGTLSNVLKIGTNYLYASGDGSLTESSTTHKCRWTPNLGVTGYYDVYVYYQIGSNRNSSAPYTVHYYGGQVTSIQNQYSTTATGGWSLIGANLPFMAGSTGYVELTTLSTDTRLVSADAAKFVLKSTTDLTPPVMTSITDDKYTTSTTSLNGRWSGSDAESGIKRYECAVGTTLGATDVKGWTSMGTATSGTIDGLSLKIGSTYFISARAVNGSDLVSASVSSTGVRVAHAAASIAEAKGFADGEPVGLPLTGVTAVFPTKFYIEDLTRASGIRVEASSALTVNQLAQVFGVLGIADGCERVLTNCKIVPDEDGPAIAPLFLGQKMTGGSAFNSSTPGITGGLGLNNVGLLVRVAGKVTAVVSDGFYIDDGSQLTDETGNIGIKVYTGAANSAEVGKWAGVAGVVSCRSASGKIYPMIVMREKNNL